MKSSSRITAAAPAVGAKTAAASASGKPAVPADSRLYKQSMRRPLSSGAAPVWEGIWGEER